MSLLALSAICLSASSTALQRARELAPPAVEQTENGEYEGAGWWSEHDALLREAWREYGTKHPSLYAYDEAFRTRYFQPQLLSAFERAKTAHDEVALRSLFRTGAPNVPMTSQMFTPLFTMELREELEHLSASGIPRRRPNGMNRYGAILSDAEGSLSFSTMLDGLTHDLLMPVALMLFPEAALPSDIDHTYGFVVSYQQGKDVSLKEHTDASVVTLNLCLHKANVTGTGDLEFQPYVPWGNKLAQSGRGSSKVSFEAGDALFHHGQHRHAALPLLSGERLNLILWLHGKWGTVRVAPYGAPQQTTPAQRWGALTTSCASEHGS